LQNEDIARNILNVPSLQDPQSSSSTSAALQSSDDKLIEYLKWRKWDAITQYSDHVEENKNKDEEQQDVDAEDGDINVNIKVDEDGKEEEKEREKEEGEDAFIMSCALLSHTLTFPLTLGNHVNQFLSSKSSSSSLSAVSETVAPSPMSFHGIVNKQSKGKKSI
jgi:hypothetical protein